MKCTYSVVDEDEFVLIITIEENKVVLKKDDERQVLEVDSKTCFNALISLFSLKDSWNNVGCHHPFYKIQFEKDSQIDSYCFGGNVPSNFSLFQAYIRKLVGEYL